MTAFNLRLPDAVFASSLKGLRLPNRNKLAAEFVFGVSEAESIKNRADPSNPLTAQGGGSITYTSVSANVRSSLTAGFGFLGNLIPADDCTLLWIAKGGLGAQCFFVGNATLWFGLRDFGANTFASNGEQSNAQGASRPNPASTDVAFTALVASRKNVQRGTGGFGKAYWYSAGVQQVATSANLGTVGRPAWNGQQFAIGSNILTDSVTTNSFDAYFCALYQRPLSPAEIDEAYNALKADYAIKGVTLV